MNKSILLATSFLINLSAWAGPSVTVGPGNPAAIFCGAEGAETYILVQRSNGNQTGMCVLPGGAAIVDATLFSLKYRNNLAVETFLNSRSPERRASGNAEAYCLDQGAQRRTYQLCNATRLVVMCQFKDGSQIEVNTLFAGAYHANTKVLRNLLLRIKKENNP